MRARQMDAETRNPCLSGLYVFDDWWSNFPENPVSAEGTFDLGGHGQLVGRESRSTIDTFIEQSTGVSLARRGFLHRSFRGYFFRTGFQLDST